jgi:hypothetical protein
LSTVPNRCSQHRCVTLTIHQHLSMAKKFVRPPMVLSIQAQIVLAIRAFWLLSPLGASFPCEFLLGFLPFVWHDSVKRFKFSSRIWQKRGDAVI